MKQASGIILAFLLILFINQNVFPHDLNIIRVFLQETDTGYMMTAHASPSLSGTLSLPVLPSGCRYVTETRNTGAGVLRLKFSCDGRALNSKDTLNFNWPVNGIVITAKWKDHTVATQFFPAKEGVIRAEMRLLRAGSPSFGEAFRRYTVLGIGHILMGIDHLFFILGLLLIVRTKWQLVKTITAFTIAHSITLACTSLGYINAPPRLITALVALSIIFIGVEVIHAQRGENNFTQKYPWVIAFTFGLLHGFGFAGALNSLGLPETEIPLALFTFNAGVEIGQLIFVAVFIILGWAFRQLEIRPPRWAFPIPGYLIGTLATYWFFIRLSYIF